MKYSKIILFFGITLPASILMRFLQILFTVDATTGFFKNEYNKMGFYLLVVILAACACLAVICFTGHRNPEHPPKMNPVLSISSCLLAVVTFIELFSGSFPRMVMKWQLVLLVITGIAASVYFAVYGLSSLIKYKLPPLSAVIPAIYFIVKIICTFTSISSLALISDNIMLLSVYCVAMLFFLCFGKLYNSIDNEYNFRKLMASGLVAVVLCLTQAIPHFVINIFTDNVYLHTSNIANLSVLCLGIFIAVFTFSHFSLSNVAVARRHRSEKPVNEQFYM